MIRIKRIRGAMKKSRNLRRVRINDAVKMPERIRISRISDAMKKKTDGLRMVRIREDMKKS